MQHEACRTGAAGFCRRAFVEIAASVALWAVFVLVMRVPA